MFSRRFRRGIEGLLPLFLSLDERPAHSILPMPMLRLFQRMNRADQVHSLRLLAHLQAAGYRNPDLLVAALLHDCGKTAAHLRVWQRTLKVLARRLSPNLWRWLARPASPGHWRYPFYVLQAHPTLGAEWVQAAGGSPTAVWLIRYHEQEPDPEDLRYPLMRALQDADAVS